jgi:hypothetical protein
MKKNLERRMRYQAVHVDRRRSDDDIATQVFAGFRPTPAVKSMSSDRPAGSSRKDKQNR